MLVAPLLRTLMKAGHASRGRCQGQAPHLRGRAGALRHNPAARPLAPPEAPVEPAPRRRRGLHGRHADAGGRRDHPGDFLHLVGANLHLLDENAVIRARNWLAQWVRPLQQHNPVGRAQRNVAHHYDLSDDLYELFLDPDRQYSCAYFDTPNHSLEQAQHAKKPPPRVQAAARPAGPRRARHRLRLGRARHLPAQGGRRHRDRAHALARAAGLRIGARAGSRHPGPGGLPPARLPRGHRQLRPHRLRRHVRGTWGVKHYVEFFRKVERLLKEDGVALLHTIARWDGPSVTNPWLRKYIFPGGYCPSLSEVFAALEQTGLKSLDVEMLRLHYADTLKHWSRNFQANRERVKAVYDERFCRMWEFYLAGAEAALPPPGPHGGPDPARTAPGCGPADPRLHGGLGAPPTPPDHAGFCAQAGFSTACQQPFSMESGDFQSSSHVSRPVNNENI